MDLDLWDCFGRKKTPSYNRRNTVKVAYPESVPIHLKMNTVKILKFGTPEIITIIVLQLEQLDFTVQHCVQKMQTD